MSDGVMHNSIRNFKSVTKDFWSGKTYVAFDTETTGLSCKVNSIIELSAVKFNFRGTVGEPFSVLIKPQEEISPFITELTGITNEMLEDGMTEGEAVRKFLAYAGGDSILVAHNAPFDIHFVNETLARAKLPDLKNKFVDTLLFARMKFPQFKEEEGKGCYKLESLSKRFRMDCGKNHRALADSCMCMELFKILTFDEKLKKEAEFAGMQASLF